MAKNKLKEPIVEETTVEATETPIEDATEDITMFDAPVESVEVENKYPGVGTRAYRS